MVDDRVSRRIVPAKVGSTLQVRRRARSVATMCTKTVASFATSRKSDQAGVLRSQVYAMMVSLRADEQCGSDAVGVQETC